MNKPKSAFALTMESEAFAALKSDFNQVLRRTLTNMERKESEQAELTLKLKISLEKDSAPDFQQVQYQATRDIVKPTFTHKVSSVMQIKDEKSGVLGGNYELVWDKDQGDFFMRPIDNGQISLFNCAEQNNGPFYLVDGSQKEAQGEDESKENEIMNNETVVEANYTVVENQDSESVDGEYSYDEPEESSSEEDGVK